MRITDEQIIAALLSCRTNAAAARKLGVSEKTLYVRMKREGFRAKMQVAQDKALEQALASMGGSISSAVDVIGRVMRDAGAPGQTRLNAADCLLRNYLRLSEHVELTARIAALEAKAKERRGINDGW